MKTGMFSEGIMGRLTNIVNDIAKMMRRLDALEAHTGLEVTPKLTKQETVEPVLVPDLDEGLVPEGEREAKILPEDAPLGEPVELKAVPKKNVKKAKKKSD